MKHHSKGFFVRHFGLRGVAVFEALKGLLAFSIGIWVLTLMHKDIYGVAEHMLRRLHVSLDRHFAQRILHLANAITDRNLWLFFAVISAYTAVRFTEAIGLWLEKEWAEWFALLSGALYLPFEVYELVRHHSAVTVAVLLINILIVLYMAWLLNDSYKRRRAIAAALQPSPDADLHAAD
jgi:uncharacterized membrane protein (DUF2068 family)